MRRPLLVLAISFSLFAIIIAVSFSRSPAPTSAQLAQLPTITLPPVEAATPGLDSELFRQQPVTILNVFASWCVPCIAEMPLLLKLAEDFPIAGIAWLDRPEDTQRFLSRYGNPFFAIGAAEDTMVDYQLAFSAIPVTLVVDQELKIVFRHDGPLTEEVVAELRQHIRD